MRLFSVKMRSEKEGKHVSGAERIVNERDLKKVINELIERPKDFDFLNIKVEEVKNYEIFPFKLKISSFSFESVNEAREFAIKKLVETGVNEEIAKKGIEILSKGANPKGGNMRGAVLLDIESGDRLEPNKERGIRTVNFDWEDRERVSEILLKKGFTHRTVDALVLAQKNIYCGVIAELCWSDDPNYITGYVASKELGYVRITPLKEKGDTKGGRVYFIKRENLNDLIECLEKKVILFRFFP